jgi:hypothetical protein
VSLAETGYASATVTPNATGTTLGAIELYGSHSHQHTLNVYEGPQNVAAQFFTSPPNNCMDSYVSGGVYKWETKDDLGHFDPSWTVTVDFSVTVDPATQGFTSAALLNIDTPQIHISLHTGQLDTANEGLKITNSTGGTIYQDVMFDSGTYTGQWTFPAAQIETLSYASRMLSGPSGTFEAGTYVSEPFMGYSFKMQLNT